MRYGAISPAQRCRMAHPARQILPSDVPPKQGYLMGRRLMSEGSEAVVEMKVEGPKGPSSVQGKKVAKTTRASGPGFASELGRVSGSDDAADSAAAVENASGIAGVEGIFAAQSVDPGAGQSSPEERRKRAQRGAEILDRLEEIRRGLLLGAIPKDKLADLARLVRDKREKGADPVISRLLDEIELRAEVELAKLSRRLA
jgi:hypothetical protein